MSSFKRLEKRHEALEEEYEELIGKLKRLKRDWIIKADTEVKFELEKRIEGYELKITEIEKQLEELEIQIRVTETESHEQRVEHPLSPVSMTNLVSYLDSPAQHQQVDNIALRELQNSFDYLHRALLKLGFWEQHRLFNTVTREHSHSAFLIRGDTREHGQRWLLNRLALSISKSLEGKNIVIDLNRRASRSDIQAIWSEFAGRVGLSEKSLPSLVVDMVYKLWQSQNVIIVFNNVDESVKENLHDLLNEFWATMVYKLSKNNDQKYAHKLLMFFLDYKNVVTNWDIGFCNYHNSDWEPANPLGLPEINFFSSEILMNWIEQQSDGLPTNISADPTSIAAQIIKEENGIPEPTLRNICTLCSCNWYEQESKWLRL